MSGIIKSLDVSGHSAVRPLLRSAPPEPPSAQEAERERYRGRIAQLESDLRQRDAVAAGLRADIEVALMRGKDEGHAAGLRDAASREAERIALLEAGLRQARSALDEKLASLEGAAAQLAVECLDIVFGDRKYRAGTVRKLLTRQATKVEKSALLAVEVSCADFPEEALAELARDVGSSGVAVKAVAGLPSGGCRMVLRLGRMEVGIGQQWSRLREVLCEQPQVTP